MVDIHCHLLSGLDDGPDSLETSIEMAEMALADGITHVVATPHSNDRYTFIPELVQKRRDEIQERFSGRLVFATGCDFHLSYENLKDIHLTPEKYTINQKSYLLVEFADFAIPPSSDQTLHELHLIGLKPIITHPERNPLIRANPERLYRWLRQGCYAQVTASSFLGRFGPSAKHMAEHLLQENCIHFIASDAHNLTSRPLKLSAAFDRVRELKGEEVAHALCRDNPLAAFEGRPLPFAPDPPEPATSSKDAALPARRKRFWFF